MMKIMEMMAVLYKDTMAKTCRRSSKRIKNMEVAPGEFFSIL